MPSMRLARPGPPPSSASTGDGPRRSEPTSPRTAHLLLAVAPTLASGEHVPGTPSQAILQGSEDFLPAFLTAHELELRQVRYRTLVAACDLAYGGASEQWCRDGTVDGQRVYDLAMGSEEGLALVLAHLEEVFAAKKGAPRRR